MTLPTVIERAVATNSTNEHEKEGKDWFFLFVFSRAIRGKIPSIARLECAEVVAAIDTIPSPR